MTIAPSQARLADSADVAASPLAAGSFAAGSFAAGSFAVAFLARPASLLTRAIHLVTGSPTHVELVFSDGRTFTAAAGRGAYWSDRLSPRAVWHVLPVAALLAPAARADLAERERAARVLCGAYTGVGYDYLGAVGFPLRLDHRDRVQCAEIVALALEAAGLPRLTHLRTPRALYHALVARRAALADQARALAHRAAVGATRFTPS